MLADSRSRHSRRTTGSRPDAPAITGSITRAAEDGPQPVRCVTCAGLGGDGGLPVEVALGLAPDLLAGQLACLSGLEVAVCEVDSAVLAGDPSLVGGGGERLRDRHSEGVAAGPGLEHRGGRGAERGVTR